MIAHKRPQSYPLRYKGYKRFGGVGQGGKIGKVTTPRVKGPNLARLRRLFLTVNRLYVIKVIYRILT